MQEKTQKRQTPPITNGITKINMKLIDPFPNHPFYVFDDEEMQELIESIRKSGLLNPIIVRRRGNRYEVISGHRRKFACERLGHREIACSVVDPWQMTDKNKSITKEQLDNLFNEYIGILTDKKPDIDFQDVENRG